MTTYTKNLHNETNSFTAANISVSETTGNLSAYARLIENLKFSHFGLIAIALLFGSCLGGIATMFVFENNAPFWQFVLSLGISMANLVACIAQAPTKWVVNLFAACMIINTILLVINVV